MNLLSDRLNLAMGLPPILCAIFLSFPTLSWGLTPQEVFATTVNSVAMLEVLDDAGKALGRYSAIQINRRKFVAVCDVLDLGHTFRLSLQSASHNGKITARDRERNLCIIEVDQTLSDGIAIQKKIPLAGNPVFAVSNALGLGVGISEGIVSGVRHFPSGDYIQFTAAISPGSEGGALVDEHGQLLGIIDYRRRDGQNVNFASFASWLAEIEARSAANADQLKRLAAATELKKQQRWQDLAKLAADWLRENFDSEDALRFSISATHGLQDVKAELAAWQALHRISPTQRDVDVGLGRVLLSNGNRNEALELAKNLVATHPEFANARMLLALAHHVSGSLLEAEASYKKAIELDPWLMEAYQGLAYLARSRGDSANAIAIWQRLSGLYPNASDFRFELIEAYLTAGKIEHAYSSLEKINEKDKNLALTWYWRGLVLKRLGRPNDAVWALQTSLEKKFDHVDWAWEAIGLSMVEMQRYPEAILAFEKALKENPNNDDLRFQLVVNLKDDGRAPEALTMITALIEKSPSTARYWRQQGFVFSELGKPLEAISAMQRSLQLEPNQPKVWRLLITAMQTAGQRKEAIEAYHALRNIDATVAAEVYRAKILPYEEVAQ